VRNAKAAGSVVLAELVDEVAADDG